MQALTAKNSGQAQVGSVDQKKQQRSKKGWLRCAVCKAELAEEEAIFSMTEEGVLGSYVNPHGYLHEVITVRQTQGLGLAGAPTAEHSWFAGYAWTIAGCLGCGTHAGWLFEATDGAHPRDFWALRRASVLLD